MVLTKEEKKERKRIYDKEYRKQNKEKIQEYGKEWRVKNREKNIERVNKWRLENPQKHKQYLIDNAHIYVISRWKNRGLISDDYKALYDDFINATHCQVCDKLFDKENKMNYKCMDHDHDTGLFRCFACFDCNIHNKMIK